MKDSQESTETINCYALSVDASKSSEGYIRASCNRKTDKKLKLRIIKDGFTMTYDLKNDGSPEIFPLNRGNGDYQITLYQNAYGNKYSYAGMVNLHVDLENEDIPFLVPNQYVMYSEESEVVKIAYRICKDKSSRNKLDAVRRYVKENLSYDFIKAATRKTGMIPDIDGSLKKRMGICGDLASIAVAMLRSQGIPSKLVVGYADKQYHAWTKVKIDGKWIIYDPSVDLFATMKPSKYIEEKYY